MSLIVVPLILILIIIYNAKFTVSGSLFDIQTSESIKGASALIIVLHHISLLIFPYSALQPFQYVGYLFVSVFFMFSGFGTLFSFNKKKFYINGFLRKRIPRLLVPLIISNIIYLVVFLWMGEKISVQALIQYMIGIKLINSQAWYVVVILLYYIWFYSCYRFLKHPMSFWSLSIFIIFYAVVVGVTDIRDLYGYSALSLIIGITIAEGYPIVIEMLRKRLILNIILFLLLSIVFIGSSFLTTGIIQYVLYCVSGLTVVLSIVLLSLKIEIGNTVLKFLGSISYEIYLIHGVFITIFKEYFINVNKLLLVFSLYLFVILFAWILSKIDRVLIKYINEFLEYGIRENKNNIKKA